LAGTSFITTSTSTHRVGYTQYTYTIKDSTYSYTKIATLGENIEGGLDGIGIMTSFSLLPKNSAYQDYSSVYGKNSDQYQYIRHTTGTISLSDCEYTEPDINNQTRYIVSVNFTISDFGISTSLTNEYIAELYMSPQNSDNYQTTGKIITLSASSTSGQFILDNAFTGAQKIRILVKVTNKNNGINSSKEFYSNFLTIFNTSSFPPTVSYRKNYLGFNIADPESDSYKDCILVFGEAVNPNNGNEITRNRIIFVGTKEDYCVAENFRFDGGSW
jgi:hypothetical protein